MYCSDDQRIALTVVILPLPSGLSHEAKLPLGNFTSWRKLADPSRTLVLYLRK